MDYDSETFELHIKDWIFTSEEFYVEPCFGENGWTDTIYLDIPWTSERYKFIEYQLVEKHRTSSYGHSHGG